MVLGIMLLCKLHNNFTMLIVCPVFLYFNIVFNIFVSISNSFQQKLLLSKTNICHTNENFRHIILEYKVHDHLHKTLSLICKISPTDQTRFISSYQFFTLISKVWTSWWRSCSTSGGLTKEITPIYACIVINIRD
jgi:hypothetical protein